MQEPIMFTMPLLCLVFNICPYGVDALLWTTHFFKLLTTCVVSSFADWSLELSAAAVYGQTMSRVLFWVNVKAVLNTVMVRFLGASGLQSLLVQARYLEHISLNASDIM
jgi:hypothetical protein